MYLGFMELCVQAVRSQMCCYSYITLMIKTSVRLLFYLKIALLFNFAVLIGTSNEPPFMFVVSITLRYLFVRTSVGSNFPTNFDPCCA